MAKDKPKKRAVLLERAVRLSLLTHPTRDCDTIRRQLSKFRVGDLRAIIRKLKGRPG